MSTPFTTTKSFRVDNRVGRQEVAKHTLGVLKYCEYLLGDKRIPVDVKGACESTILYTPESKLNFPLSSSPSSISTPTPTSTTRISVVQESTLEAIRRLLTTQTETKAQLHPKPKLRSVCALNFASARSPGGGFLNGATAQEESLARSSALYACLTLDRVQQFYKANEAPSGGFYTDHIIYSGHVPVFRKDDGSLLAEPHSVAMLTVPAVNAGLVYDRSERQGRSARDVQPEIDRRMQYRIERLLGVAAEHKHDTLVLGAFGAGVFRHSADRVAKYFAEALAGPFRSVFAEVVFAIYDKGPNLYAFQKRFG